MKKLAKFTLFAAICAAGAWVFALFAKSLADQNSELNSMLSQDENSSSDDDYDLQSNDDCL